MKIDIDKIGEFNKDFEHTKVSIICHTESELQAVKFIGMYGDALVDVSTGIHCSSETRANIGLVITTLFKSLFYFEHIEEEEDGKI